VDVYHWDCDIPVVERGRFDSDETSMVFELVRDYGVFLED
jgi:hypothetical protein